jgi:hypothetical protein
MYPNSRKKLALYICFAYSVVKTNQFTISAKIPVDTLKTMSFTTWYGQTGFF